LMGKVEKSCLKRFQVSRIKIVAAASHAAPTKWNGSAGAS